MLKLRPHQTFDHSDYDRLGICRDAAMQRFKMLAPGLGVSEEMIISACAQEAMDRLVRSVAESCLIIPVSLNDMADAMMPGLMRSAQPDLLSADLVAGSSLNLVRSMGSLCQLHRREVVMVKAICEISRNAAPQLHLVASDAMPHAAFLTQPQPVAAFSSTTAG